MIIPIILLSHLPGKLETGARIAKIKHEYLREPRCPFVLVPVGAASTPGSGISPMRS